MAIDFAKGDGLVPAVVQDAATGMVLMVGYMNDEALRATLGSGVVTFWSRSKRRLWVKGESSGHTLKLVELLTDCDRDAIVARALPQGPGVCHEGYASCFYTKLEKEGSETTVLQKSFDPAAVYGGAR